MTSAENEQKAGDHITVTRHPASDLPASTWSVGQDGEGWNVTSPDGAQSGGHSTAIEALSDSRVCQFAPDVALDIRTAGLVSPFDLLSVLESWTDPSDYASENADWIDHPELGMTQECLQSWPAADALGLESSRVIRVDNGFVGVHTARRDSTGGSQRHLIVFRDNDWMRPDFYDPWASASTDNGWGIASYDIGEIVPGLVGEVMHVEDWGPNLSVWQLPDDHPKGLYERMIEWISGCISNTFEEYDIEVEVDGGSVTAILPEEGPYGEGSGHLGLTALSEQARTAVKRPHFEISLAHRHWDESNPPI